MIFMGIATMAPSVGIMLNTGRSELIVSKMVSTVLKDLLFVVKKPVDYIL